MHLWQVLNWRIKKKYKVIYKHGPSTVAAIFAAVAVSGWLLFVFFSSFPVFAYAYYFVRPITSTLMARALQQTTLRPVELRSGTATPPPSTAIATKDISLPEGHYLSIPAIGVDTVLWEASTDEYESALKRGVWRVPDFGSPDEVSAKAGKRPMILAAHRFGYVSWTQAYRIQNSFYNLPKLKVGDTIEVMWDQRRYSYTVEQVVEGTEIDDYASDLILYTCKFLVSPLRVFVYATLTH